MSKKVKVNKEAATEATEVNATISSELEINSENKNKNKNENEACATIVENKTENIERSNDKMEKKSLKEYFEEYENASIRKLANVTGINYGILLKKSKEPIAGQPYDPEAINWAAVEEKLQSKNIDYSELDWEALNEGRSHRGSSLIKDMDAFTVGKKVYLRRDNNVPFEIVYKTDTHIVIMQEGKSEPLAWSHNTFLINGPVFERRANSNESSNNTENENNSDEA